MINITFPDGNVRQYAAGTTALDVAKSISEGLARVVLAASRQRRSARPDAAPSTPTRSIVFHKWDDKEGKQTYWHSSAHLLAEALEALFPGTKFGIGPAIDNGFYYDVDTGDRPLTAADFAKIEQKMLELARTKSEYQRTRGVQSRCDQVFHRKRRRVQTRTDRGPGRRHRSRFTSRAILPTSAKARTSRTRKPIKAVKMLNLAGAYWRGDDQAQTTDAHLRHHLPETKGTGRIPA
ncbi:MAG: TGS domain-containing protein [Dermatophilaceae bacterium]